MKGITAIKSHGETFKFHCSYSSRNERAGDTYNFTKLNARTRNWNPFIREKYLTVKTITNYSDTGTHCCVP